jgi:PIN domain nuclease of toxin-antitoxin system
MMLLDTHVWWWALNEPNKLSSKALKVIKKNPPSQRAIASISMWEFAMMVSTGRVEIRIPLDQWLDQAVNKSGLEVFDLSPKVAAESCNLPGDFHKDPADRIIVATARINGISLITKDKKIIDYPYVETIW